MDRNLGIPDVVELLGDWAVGRGPIYRRLAESLERIIREGGLHPGDPLPPERPFARALAVSRATVVSAYDRLRERGIVDSRQGSGTRVNRFAAPLRQPLDGRVTGGRATSLFQRMIDGPAEVISLARAVDAAAPEVRTVLQEVVDADLGELLKDTGYRPAGLPALRAAVADQYGSQGLPTTPEQVLITSGTQQALNLISTMYIRRGTSVMVESPSWPGCLDAFRAAKARLLGVPLDDEGIDLRIARQVMAEHQPVLMFVMPTYHNPTGLLMTGRRRAHLADLAAQHNVVIVEDNNFLPPDGPDGAPGPAPIAAYGSSDAQVLTTGTLTKLVWGGLRIGWLRGPAELIERLARLKAMADLGNPFVDQAVAARLMPRLPAIAARRLAEARGRMEVVGSLIAEKLPEWEWRMPAGGSALWVRLPGADTRAFAQVALRHGIEVVPGASMDSSGRHDDHIRVPCVHPEDVLVEMVDRLENAWRDAATAR